MPITEENQPKKVTQMESLDDVISDAVNRAIAIRDKVTTLCTTATPEGEPKTATGGGAIQSLIHRTNYLLSIQQETLAMLDEII